VKISKQFLLKEDNNAGNVSDKNKQLIDKWISQFGERETAVKIIDSYLRNRLGGLESSDLPDTSTFANGLDDIEEFLKHGDYKSALVTAKDTAIEMLEEEGFSDSDF